MANLNLSEFTEKLFVADADHTFIWDTAASISKRVSRNSWLNSGTLTSDAPVTISQTWNQIGTTFTAFKVNAVSTASASGSLLLDLQVGTVSKFSVDKNGNLISTGTSITTAPNGTWGSPSALEIVSGGHIRWASRGRLYSTAADSISILDSTATLAATLAVEATNTLALRNGAAAQTFRVYKSYLNAGVDYERLSFSHDGVQFGIGTERAGSGIAQPLRFFGGSSAALDFANGVSFRNASGGTTFMTVASSGNVGIGTTAPSANLELYGNSGQTVLKITSVAPGTGSNLIFNGAFGQLNNNAGSFFITNESATDHVIFRAGGQVERMRITSTGNVGIGTTSPTSKLQVANGDVEIETVTSGIIMKAAGTANRYRITLNAGGTDFVITAL